MFFATGFFRIEGRSRAAEDLRLCLTGYWNGVGGASGALKVVNG